MCNKKDVLAYRFGGETAEQWLAIFREYRWDLEEEAEALIPPSRKTITVDMVILRKIVVFPFYIVIGGVLQARSLSIA